MAVERLQKEQLGADAQGLFETLRAAGVFKGLTLAHVKRAEERARRLAERAQQQMQQEQQRAAAAEAARAVEAAMLLTAQVTEAAVIITDPTRCRLKGEGLVQAKTREAAVLFAAPFFLKTVLCFAVATTLFKSFCY